MAYNKQGDLVKVGMEGFAMVDECYGRKAARQLLSRYQYQPQESHVYVVTCYSSPTKDASASLDCYEAAKIYGGTLIRDYPKKKPTRMTYY